MSKETGVQLKIISKGDLEKNARRRGGEKEKGPGRNPGGAQIVLIELTTMGRVSSTRHLCNQNGHWVDRFGNKYNV